MKRAYDLGELNEAARRVSQESGGMLSVDVIRPVDFVNLLADAMAGDAEAFWLVRTAGDAIAGFASMASDSPALCACCPRPLVSGGYAVAVVKAASNNPGQGIALGICSDCATEPDDLLVKAREGLARIWPDVRPVVVTHPSGGQA